jgi:hypothetical protein
LPFMKNFRNQTLFHCLASITSSASIG